MTQQSVAQKSAVADDKGISALPVRDNVYMLAAASGNVTVQFGDDGILLVDTMSVELSEQLLTAVRALSDRPIRYIINTSADVAHTGGNATVAQAGSTISGGNVGKAITDAKTGAAVIAQESVLTRMSTAEPASPFEGWPTSTYIAGSKSLYFNGEGIYILHQPHAHTSGDSIVYFRRSDVISTGDIYTPGRYPFIDVENGGSLKGIIDAVNSLIELTIPADKQEGGTLVIPGRGRLGDESDLVEYRDMLTLIRDYIAEMIKEGRSLQQIQKARPTLGYDVVYGQDSGPWTTEQFVAAIYHELKKGS